MDVSLTVPQFVCLVMVLKSKLNDMLHYDNELLGYSLKNLEELIAVVDNAAAQTVDRMTVKNSSSISEY